MIEQYVQQFPERPDFEIRFPGGLVLPAFRIVPAAADTRIDASGNIRCQAVPEYQNPFIQLYLKIFRAVSENFGGGFGGIAGEAQKLIAPMTEYSLQNYFVKPLERSDRQRKFRKRFGVGLE